MLHQDPFCFAALGTGKDRRPRGGMSLDPTVSVSDPPILPDLLRGSTLSRAQDDHNDFFIFALPCRILFGQ
jgi:hypothetical protein